ncbi:MAG: hypothetical protein Q9226_006097 [Calogaya cf. arnoldii]
MVYGKLTCLQKPQKKVHSLEDLPKSRSKRRKVNHTWTPTSKMCVKGELDEYHHEVEDKVTGEIVVQKGGVPHDVWVKRAAQAVKSAKPYQEKVINAMINRNLMNAIPERYVKEEDLKDVLDWSKPDPGLKYGLVPDKTGTYERVGSRVYKPVDGVGKLLVRVGDKEDGKGFNVREQKCDEEADDEESDDEESDDEDLSIRDIRKEERGQEARPEDIIEEIGAENPLILNSATPELPDNKEHNQEVHPDDRPGEQPTPRNDNQGLGSGDEEFFSADEIFSDTEMS